MGGMLGKRHSVEAKRKMSLAKIGYAPWNKGKNGYTHKPHTEEAKRKMSLAAIGNKKFLGKTHTPEVRKRMSESKKGQNNPCWKGGITPQNKLIRSSVEYRLWRESVLQRDGYNCIWCGSNKNLHADHIKSFADYPELRFAIDNGRTLCEPCHSKTDNYKSKQRYV